MTGIRVALLGAVLLSLAPTLGRWWGGEQLSTYDMEKIAFGAAAFILAVGIASILANAIWSSRAAGEPSASADAEGQPPPLPAVETPGSGEEQSQEPGGADEPG